MAILRILGRTTSINVRKILWCCAELDVQYQLEPWGSGVRSTDTPEFRQLNPNAMVPVLVDGTFVLWESNAICRYLAAAYGGDRLWHREPRERAPVDQWMDWQSTELNNAWRYAFMALVRKSPLHRNDAAAAASAIEWNRHMAILDAQLLRTGAFVTGPAFTLADIGIGLAAHRWLLTPIQRPDLRGVEAFYERLKQRRCFVEHARDDVP